MSAGRGAKQRQDWTPCQACVEEAEEAIAKIAARLMKETSWSVRRCHDRAAIEYAKGVRE